MEQIAKKVWEIEDSIGWHDKTQTLSEQLSNITAEIGEIWEEWRTHKGLHETYYECKAPYIHPCNKICKDCVYGKPCGIPSEFADIIIWILDYCTEVKIPIAEILFEKLKYNSTREYRHGKKV